MNVSGRVLFCLMIVCSVVCAQTAWGQSKRRDPHIGYLYPSGGQKGSVIQIMVGGQYLGDVSDVYVSGEGVRASIVRFMGGYRRLKSEERRELKRRLSALRQKKQAESSGERIDTALDGRKVADEDSAATERTTLPNHPLLNNLDDLSLEQLEFVEHKFLTIDRKNQPNAQIAEAVLVEIAIDQGAVPGDRNLRLGSSKGLTNPMCFQVGLLPEVCEPEPYDRGVSATSPLDLPVLMNGQIMPGDADRFSFRAKEGQHLVIQTHARHLIPYLADAVPGWFQATLALHDTAGNEVAFADDYRFNPDPVLLYKVKETGVYELEIRDAIYRGREDFVYRISVGEQPFITSMFPLGGRAGEKTIASIDGWNLQRKRLSLNTRTGTDHFKKVALRRSGSISNHVTYAVDTLPECNETESNNKAQDAQRITLPVIINGRISRPGDVDVFRFEGRAGDDVVVEVHARRLHSPLDSLLRLIDASGRVLAWNDDREEVNTGLLTHHADSYLIARLVEDGKYCVRLTDSQHHGGREYGYRLRIGPLQPDFALRMTPSSISVPGGRAVSFCVHASRKEGFDGEIELALKDAPPGFALDGGRIPGSRDKISVTLTAPRSTFDQPVVLRLEGRSRIHGKEVIRPVIPSEELTQAFIYRHLVPSQELMVAVTGSRGRGMPVRLAGDGPLRIPVKGTARARFMIPRRAKLPDIQLALHDPPEGVILQDVIFGPRGFSIELKAEGNKLQAGFMDNLIVEAFTKRKFKSRKGKSTNRMQRVSLGVLPAIPFEIVEFLQQ